MVKPMLAVLGDISILKDNSFIFEPKLDGYRAILHKSNHEIKFTSRNELDLTKKFPELNVEHNIKAKSAVLDGEIVIYNRKGKPDFQLLQGRRENPSTIDFPATYVVFDILEKDGKSLIDLPLLKRKKILNSTIRGKGRIQVNLYTKQGEKLWREINKIGMEGIMAKKKDSVYNSSRSTDWIKIKLSKTLDTIILGFVKGKRNISSLILGVYSKGKIINIGRVGTGFSEDLLGELEKRLTPLAISKEKDITFVKPLLVAEVKYHELTKDNQLRASTFITLRDDKTPEECLLP